MHVHYWKVSTPAHGEHIIGECKCGAKKDFTEIQEQDQGYRQICLTNTLTASGIDMTKIMAVKKPKGRPSKYSRGRVR